MVRPTPKNHYANHLAWIASSRTPTPLDVIIKKLSKPSVKPTEEDAEAAKPDLMIIDEPE
jgi:hypothetical protein